MKHGLAPRLLNADYAGVDEVTDVDVGEGIHEIRERHPANLLFFLYFNYIHNIKLFMILIFL